MDIEVNNIRIHYEVLGDGKSIILLNPNSVNTGLMKFIANKLKVKYKVYIFDRRCCGKSEKNCILTYEESAKDVYEFITKLNLDKPYLLGCSGGGTVALNVAIHYPESISKLILCSGVARNNVIENRIMVRLMFSLFTSKGINVCSISLHLLLQYLNFRTAQQNLQSRWMIDNITSNSKSIVSILENTSDRIKRHEYNISRTH